jgi:methionyl aminopeptidase
VIAWRVDHDGWVRFAPVIILRTSREIATIREAGRVVANVLAAAGDAADVGVKPIELDQLARRMLREAGAVSSFEHYHPRWAPIPYPAVICLSVNDAIVHGIPDARPLRNGDILSIDFGAAVDGLHADAAITVPIGDVDEAGLRLIRLTESALQAGIAASRPGNRLGDIGAAVGAIGRGAGYGLAENLGGHGVGDAMHEDPHVANEGIRGRGLKLQPGLVIAIEPMFIEGGHDEHDLRPDGWTVVTSDGSRAAHQEHTLAVTKDGPVVLTLP